MRGWGLVLALFCSTPALAEPVRLVAVSRVRDAQSGDCDEALDREWREALKKAADSHIELIEEPLDGCSPSDAFGSEAPFALVAHSGRRGVVLSIVDRAAHRTIATRTALKEHLDDLAEGALAEIPDPPPPEPQQRYLAEEPGTIRLDLPKKTDAELDARIAELPATRPSAAHTVALAGFLGAGVLATAAALILPFWTEKTIPGPLGSAPFVTSRSLVDPTLVLGVGALAALFTGCGGVIASNGEDAAREEELEMLLVQRGTPDPLGAPIQVIDAD